MRKGCGGRGDEGEPGPHLTVCQTPILPLMLQTTCFLHGTAVQTSPAPRRGVASSATSLRKILSRHRLSGCE